MGLIVSDFLDYLNEIAPSQLADKNDPIGLQIGSLKAEVIGCLIALDATLEVCQIAKDHGLNLIITHHPLFFHPLQRLTRENHPGEVVFFAVKEGLNILSWHTPLDKVSWGVSAALAEKIALPVVGPICSETSSGPNGGYGVIAKFSKSVKLIELARKIEREIDSWVMLVGEEETEIDRLGICGGAGSFLIDTLRRQGINTLLTSDVKYHTAKAALEMGFNLLVIDHAVGEGFVLPKLEKLLKSFVYTKGDHLPFFVHLEKSPYKIINRRWD